MLAGSDHRTLDTGAVDEAAATRLAAAPGRAAATAVSDAPEAFDDGNLDDYDVCTSACVAAACGDTILQTPEGQQIVVADLGPEARAAAGRRACDDG